MKQQVFRFGVLCLAAMMALAFASGCAKKKVEMPPYQEKPAVEEKGVITGPERTEPPPRQEPGPSEAEMREEEMRRQSRTEQQARQRFVNQDIHFPYDSDHLTARAQDILRQKAEYMRRNPRVYVTIEGHCDERGTNEYNMALGERRAQSAKSFLIRLGISPDRMTTLSYGEERPLDPRSNEEAWAKNRRAHFLIR